MLFHWLLVNVYTCMELGDKLITFAGHCSARGTSVHGPLSPLIIQVTPMSHRVVSPQVLLVSQWLVMVQKTSAIIVNVLLTLCIVPERPYGNWMCKHLFLNRDLSSAQKRGWGKANFHSDCCHIACSLQPHPYTENNKLIRCQKATWRQEWLRTCLF